MTKDFYVLEHVVYYYFDNNDCEDVEDREIVGYFSNFKKLNNAISLIKKHIKKMNYP